jgi:hypothetical protein
LVSEAGVTDHPYRTLPDYCFWRGSIVGVPFGDVDPVVRTKFRIAPDDRIATAGSCFAQHIARYLTTGGLTYFVTETAHPLIAHISDDYNYSTFTARYGNICTSRQFLQTIQRAYGAFVPEDDTWPWTGGRVVDPYRPRIQPNGFARHEELAADRAQHFAAIRRAVEEADVFIFTLGLTEAWFHRSNGAVYPLCPGVVGGTFDEARHGFVNLGVTEVTGDLCETIDLIKARNANTRFILTVSPVPLAATRADRSVLTSTTYSKSVLRVAAEDVAARYDSVDYFPSYEIVTGAHARGQYFDEGLRDDTEAGVSHVMRLFMKHYADDATRVVKTAEEAVDHRQRGHDGVRRELEEFVAVMCDELELDARRVKLSVAPVPLTPVQPTARAAPAPAGPTVEIKAPTAWDVLSGAAAPSTPPTPISPPIEQRPKSFWSSFGWRR